MRVAGAVVWAPDYSAVALVAKLLCLVVRKYIYHFKIIYLQLTAECVVNEIYKSYYSLLFFYNSW